MPLAVCATPIGNLADVTLRVLEELRGAEVVLAEDTRHARVLLDRHGIAARLLSYHEHNEAERVPEILRRLEAGARVALVSDAGLPAVSDPGRVLVHAALAAGYEVTVLPGPSAVETALVASGLPSDAYAFVGFLPRRAAELTALCDRLASWQGSLVAFESPNRLAASLRVLAGIWPDREAAVCRELTKRFEEVARGVLAELAVRFAEPVKGEVTLVLGPIRSEPGEAAAVEAAAAVAELVRSGVPRRRAAELISGLTGVSRNALYRGSL